MIAVEVMCLGSPCSLGQLWQPQSRHTISLTMRRMDLIHRITTSRMVSLARLEWSATYMMEAKAATIHIMTLEVLVCHEHSSEEAYFT